MTDPNQKNIEPGKPDREDGLADLPAERYVGPGSSKIRCFLALNLPVPVIRRVGDEVAALRPLVEATGVKVAWVPAANLHVTLKFFGMIEERSVEGVRDCLRKKLADRSPFELEVKGLGAFPDLADPRVLYAGVVDKPALAALQKDVERWMEELGFPREPRPWKPHLTVGRTGRAPAVVPVVPVVPVAPAVPVVPALPSVTTALAADPAPEAGAPEAGVIAASAGSDAQSAGARSAGAIAPILVERESKVYGTGRVHEVVIYESKTLSRGAEYRALARVPIGPARGA